MLVVGPDLLINDKWLDFDASHKELPCSLFAEATAQGKSIARLSCSHIVKHLYDLVLVEVSCGSTSPQSSTDADEYLRQQVYEKIDQMPCMVELTRGEEAGTLEVSWVHAESEKIWRLHGLELKGRVTMHRRSSCVGKVSGLLTSGEYFYRDGWREC
jgi:hypothetical protein